MSKNTKKLVPKLRFPEFRDDAAWSTKPLSSLAKLITEKAGGTNYTLLSVTAGVGLVTQLEKFGREIAGESYKNYVVIEKGDFAYNKSSTKQHPEGQIALLEKIERGAVPNSIFTCFRVDKGIINPYFLKYPFANNIHGKWLRNFIAVGARANGALQVDSKDLLSLPVDFPFPKEQQKIANCLSSIDDLINAQSQKVEALKTHKKGLMQQLFPREGETVPRLRFTEFRDAGEWGKSKLGNLVEIRSGYSPSAYELIEGGAYPFVKVEDLNNCEKYQVESREYSFDVLGLIPTNSIIFPKRGAAIALNKIRLSQRDILMDTNMMALIPNSLCYAEFLYYYLSHVGLDEIADNSTIPQINNKHIIPFDITVPSTEEQQKIANCLSSIDDLITAQVQKLESLKNHKKGLMLQLFPTGSEVEG